MTKITVLFLSALSLSLMLGGAAQSASCKQNYLQGSNAAFLTGHNKNLAKENAISSWELRALTSVGPGWKNWEKSTNRSLQCFRKLSRRWKCTARAQACKG